PGHRHRLHGQVAYKARLRVHRGQRAPRPGEPRAAADGRAFHGPAVPDGAPPGRVAAASRAGDARMTAPPIDADYLVAQLEALLRIDSPTSSTDTAVRYCSGELQRLGLSPELTRRGAIRAVSQG